MSTALLSALSALLVGSGVVNYLPQYLHLRRTATAAGLSVLGQTLGAVTYLWWLVYLVGTANWWLAVPTGVGAVFWLAVTGMVVRRLPTPRWLPTVTVGYAGGYLGALLVGGWAGLGAVLVASGVIAWAPAVLDAVRARDVSGMSRVTWALVCFDEVGWLVFGLSTGDPVLIVYGLVTTPMLAVILLRAYTGNRTAQNPATPLSDPCPR